MITTLPGGFWYPERQAISDSTVTGVASVVVAPGDAAGAQFALGALRCRGVGVRAAFAATGDFRLELGPVAGSVLRTVDWPGARSPNPADIPWVVSHLWPEPVDLADGVTYRLVCVATGSTGVTLADADRDDAIAEHGGALGVLVRRVAGVWTESPTRRITMALYIGGC